MTDTKAGEQRTCMSVACRGIVIVDWTSACGSETVELLCGHCRECDRLQVYDERRKVSGKTGELAEEVDLSTCRVCECGVHYPNGMEPTGICHPCEIGELSARVAQLEAELKEVKADAERFRWLEENGVGIQHGCAVSLVVPVGRTSGGEMVSALVHDENLRDAIDAARREP